MTADSTAGMNGAVDAILADEALQAAIGGTPYRDFDRDTYSCQLRCRDPNGETYSLTFSRGVVRLTSYEDDAIKATVNDWADTVAELC